MAIIRNLQLDKQGVTENFLETLENNFKACQNVKVVVLKSARQDKGDVKLHAEKILNKLGKNFTARIVGFTICLKKWRKPMR